MSARRAVAPAVVLALAGACAAPGGEWTVMRLDCFGYRSGAEVEVEQLAVSQAARLTDPGLGVEVLHWPRDDVAAADVLALLRTIRGRIAALLDRPPIPFGVYLRTGRAHDDDIAIEVLVPGPRVLFPLPVRGGALDDDERENAARILAHEWSELTITRAVLPGLYDRDRQTRWFGDGLAELASFLAVAEVCPGRVADLRRAHAEALRAAAPGGPRLDDWRPAERYPPPRGDPHALYARALALFLAAHDRAGDAGIARLLARAQAAFYEPTCAELGPRLMALVGG